MRIKLLGWIGIVWGGAIIVSKLVASNAEPAKSGAYAAGQTAGLVLGVLLLVVGAYYAFRKPKPQQ